MGMRDQNDFVWNEEKRAYEPKIQEEHVLKEIVQRLRYAGVPMFRECERIPTGYKLSDPGHPDLHGWIPAHKEFRDSKSIGNRIWTYARPVYIEVKKPGEMKKYEEGKLPSKRMKAIYRQSEFLDEAKRGGCLAFFAESWDDVVKAFKVAGLNLSER